MVDDELPPAYMATQGAFEVVDVGVRALAACVDPVLDRRPCGAISERWMLTRLFMGVES